jgi:hypothetical protein
MKKIGKGNIADTLSEEHGKKSIDKNRHVKSTSVLNVDDNDSPADCIGMGAFAKSLILCGAEASCIESLTGLPKEVVAKLFKEAAAEREEEFKAGARSLAERRQGKIPAQRPENQQPYSGGLLWQRRQAKALEASGCFATRGTNTPSERPRKDRRKNSQDRFRLHFGI